MIIDEAQVEIVAVDYFRELGNEYIHSGEWGTLCYQLYYVARIEHRLTLIPRNPAKFFNPYPDCPVPVKCTVCLPLQGNLTG